DSDDSPPPATAVYGPPPVRMPGPNPPGGRFDYVIQPGQSIGEVQPSPGQWVQVLPGTYGPFSFSVSGAEGNPIHYRFEPGAIVDAAGASVAVKGGTFLDIDGLVERNARNQIQTAAVYIANGTILRNALIEHNDGVGMIISGDNVQVINSIFQYNGQQGFGA